MPKPLSDPPRRPGGTALDLAGWARLLDAFRQAGARFHEVARLGGVNYRTARKAWEDGLSVRGEDGTISARPPVKDTMARERQGAQAAVAATTILDAQVRDGERGAVPVPGTDVGGVAAAIAAGRVAPAVVRELSTQEAITSLAEEAKLLRVNRANVGGMVSISANLLRGAMKLSARLQGAMENMVIAQSTPEQIADATKIIAQVYAISAMTTHAVRRHLQAERLLLGDPRKQIYEEALKGTPAPDAAFTYTREEAERELRRLQPFVAKYLEAGSEPEEGDLDANDDRNDGAG